MTGHLSTVFAGGRYRYSRDADPRTAPDLRCSSTPVRNERGHSRGEANPSLDLRPDASGSPGGSFAFIYLGPNFSKINSELHLC